MLRLTRFLVALIAGCLIMAAPPHVPADAGKKSKKSRKIKKSRKGKKSKKAPAPAPKKKTAEELLNEAVMRRGLADFEGSMKLLEQALEATKVPGELARIRLLIGANFLDMEKKAEARAAMLGALKHDPTLQAPEDMKTAVRSLYAQLRKDARGTLAVTSNLQARVKVNGKKVGKTPYEAAVPVGSHLVQLEGPGGSKRQQSVVVYPDRKVTVKLKLKGRRATKKPKKDAEGGRLWTWVVGATAVAAAGVGLGMWLWADAKHSTWEDEQAAGTADDARLDELEDGIRTREYAAYGLWGAAGVLAGTAVALFFLEGGKKQERRGASLWEGLTVTPVTGQASGLVLRGTF